MLIRVTGLAEVTLDEDGSPVRAASIIRELDGTESDSVCGDYLDIDLADLGITGGTVKLTYDSNASRFLVSTEYASPDSLDPTRLERLVRYTQAQWSDGIGESCFDDLASRLRIRINLHPSGQDKHLRIEQVDDGKKLSKPTGIAKAAREGDIVALRQLIRAGVDLNARLQGYTPLHLAISDGQAEAALELIGCGADLNALDPSGYDALMQTAVCRHITDLDAARVARALLERGVSVYGPNGPDGNPEYGEHTPLDMAIHRKKTMLASVLREFGAVK